MKSRFTRLFSSNSPVFPPLGSRALWETVGFCRPWRWSPNARIWFYDFSRDRRGRLGERYCQCDGRCFFSKVHDTMLQFVYVDLFTFSLHRKMQIESVCFALPDRDASRWMLYGRAFSGWSLVRYHSALALWKCFAVCYVRCSPSRFGGSVCVFVQKAIMSMCTLLLQSLFWKRSNAKHYSTTSSPR